MVSIPRLRLARHCGVRHVRPLPDIIGLRATQSRKQPVLTTGSRGIANQVISLAPIAADVDAGKVQANISGWVGAYANRDEQSFVRILVKDDNDIPMSAPQPNHDRAVSQRRKPR